MHPQQKLADQKLPSKQIHSPKVGSMLDQRRRRWASIDPTLGECIVFAGLLIIYPPPPLVPHLIFFTAQCTCRSVFWYKLRHIVGFRLVEMTTLTNPKPTIYRNLNGNTDPGMQNVPYNTLHVNDDMYMPCVHFTSRRH